MPLPVQCPYPAGHDMRDRFVISWLRRTENPQVLEELIGAYEAMPADYAPRAELSDLVAELRRLVAELEDSPF